YLQRMDDGRRAIVLGERQSGWRWTRGYVENVAAAIALAATDSRAIGKIYNVGEREALTEADWVISIGRVAGWSGHLALVPEARLPDHLRANHNWSQHLVGDTTRIREELNYQEPVVFEEAMRRTVSWERSLPPRANESKAFHYEAEDRALGLAN